MPPPLRTEPVPACPACGGDGPVAHADLEDLLAGVPGRWTFRRCAARDCGCLWLDPRPTAEDLPRAYASYYTHAPGPAPRPGPLRPLTAAVRRGWLGLRFGYGPPVVPAALRLLGPLALLQPAWCAWIDYRALWLRAVPGGRLLDAGCGNGDILADMAALGWRAEGLDMDPAAAAACRARGLEVREGRLDDGAVAPGAYDAVSLVHVVEHVADPRRTLRAARDALRPGGRLVVVTPNAAARGAATFGPAWRGLEPPRHLCVLREEPLRRLARDAGLEGLATFTTFRGSHGMWLAGVLARSGRSPADPAAAPLPLRVASRAVQCLDILRHPLEPGRGEELVLLARKPGPRGAA